MRDSANDRSGRVMIACHIDRNSAQFDSTPVRGVTLIEMIVVIMVLGIALTGVTQMMATINARGAGTFDETKAVALAQSYMDEVLARAYDESTPVGGVPPCNSPSAAACTQPAYFGPETTVNGSTCTRVTSAGNEDTPCELVKIVYDDVDDFDGLDEGLGSAGDQPLTDSSGDERLGYENFRVQIAVSQPDATLDAKRVVVTVTQISGDVVAFTSYKVNF